MIRPATRVLLRTAAKPHNVSSARAVGGRRFISTDPPHLKSRTWKSSALRWGLAAGGIYYYNTSPVFAEQPQHNLLNPNVDAIETDDSPTLDALTASSRAKSQKDASVLQSAIETASAHDAANDTAHPATDIPVTDASPAELEEEADQQGAFNPVTGEINWDCPCLGGMAHGPCGPEFKEAFSCFVYSTEEPKGMECIDKFQNMQNCFRAHPEHYKAELDDDEELDAEMAQEREELAGKIAERKAADKAAEPSTSAGRLLEEPAPAPKKKTKKNVKTTGGEDVLNSETSPQSSAKTRPSSEPHPGLSEEHEAINEGQQSRTLRNSFAKPVEAASGSDDTLLAKGAHDAHEANGQRPRQSASS